MDPKAIPSAAEIAADKIIELRMVKDGRTVSLALVVRVASDRPAVADTDQGPGYYLEVGLIGAEFASGADVRLDQQRRSLDVLLRHVQAHCPEYHTPPEECAHQSAIRGHQVI